MRNVQVTNRTLGTLNVIPLVHICQKEKLAVVHTCIFSDFLLLMDVKGWINNKCFGCMIPHLNISN